MEKSHFRWTTFRGAGQPVGPESKDEWRKKVHPVFVELMEQFKQNEPLSRSPWKEDREKAQAWARRAEIEFRIKGQELGEQLCKGWCGAS